MGFGNAMFSLVDSEMLLIAAGETGWTNGVARNVEIGCKRLMVIGL